MMRNQGRIATVRSADSIDCNVVPFTPVGWSVKNPHQGGLRTFSPAGISLHRYEPIQNGGHTSGWVLLLLSIFEVSPQFVSAHYLDYYLANTHLIPADWKDKCVFFPDTLYVDHRGNVRIRCLRSSGVKWYWDSRCLDENFGESDWMAVHKKAA